VGFYGAVSAVDISSDGTRLICGYAKGLITHWDLTSYKCLRFVTDAHPPGFGVLRVRFLGDPTLALFNNTGGNLFLLKFKRTIVGRNWTSECFFSGWLAGQIMVTSQYPDIVSVAMEKR
jgi:WD40 repeat protein